MPFENGKKYKDWHCSICGQVYIKRDHTRRDILNAWWEHMKEDHPRLYKTKKKLAIEKAVATRKRNKKSKE